MTVVTLPAEIDQSNAGSVSEELASAFALGVTIVIVNLTPTAFCDTAGLGEMVLVHHLAAANGIELRAVVPSGSLTRTFALTGLDRMLPVYPTLSAALAA